MSAGGSDNSQEYGEKYGHEFGGEASDEESGLEYGRKLSEDFGDFDYEYHGEDEEEEEDEAVAEDQKVKKLEEKPKEVEELDKEEDKKPARKKVVFFGDDDEDSIPGTPKERGPTDKEPPGRRKTIFDLDAFAALASLTESLAQQQEEEEEIDEPDFEFNDAIRFSETMGIPGIARIDLSPLTQKIVGVVIDENVTTEFPWLYVRKEIIEDNLDLHSESSDFLPVKNYVERYPEPRMLLGYSPNPEEEGQFYICLTQEARDAVARSIEVRRQEEQDKVRNAVYKTPGKWSHLGSGDNVSFMTVKRARPLYEIQVDTSASLLKSPMGLKDRMSDDQRDGYVEVVPYRESFSNVPRLLVDKDVKAIPSLEDREAQTILATQVNSACQCQLNLEPTIDLPPPNVRQNKAIAECLKFKVDDVCKEVYSNTLWDVYANDYAKLAETSEGPLVETRGSTEYVERQSYYEGKLCSGRLINDLAWHPQWTGIVAAVYTEISKSENLMGPKPFKEDLNPNSVLIWSFDDSLGPKLILESKRQVSSVSFHPRNGNLVVGGCINGQVHIWDITGKIEEVETVVVKTAAQVRYETVLRSMTTWMKETLSSKVVRPTVTSSLQYSQKGQITNIDWLSPYKKINERGILEKLPDDATEDMLSSQFVTSSLDGSIAFYDLDWRPPEDKKKEAAKKKKKTVEKPAGLMQSISSYKVLDNIFKPLYALITQYDNESRNAIVTAMSLRSPLLRKEQVEPFPRSADVTERKHYKILPQKQQEEESIPTRIFIGTARGECGLVSWEGYEFSTGITLTKEMCKWIWRRQLHDGPVIHAVRSQHLRDLIATVGGKIFAVWREDFDEPILWRKSESRYTSCCWASERPSVIIVGRNDGTAEIWDMSLKSHEPSATHSLSGRIITGIYAHELPLGPQCVGFCDYNGALRIFLAPAVSAEFARSDAEWMRRFVDREVQQISDFVAWRKEQREIKEQSLLEEQQKAEEQQDDSKKLSEAEEKLKEEALKAEAAKKAKAKKRKKLVEEMHAKWVSREMGRMQVAILTKKGLREEELERRIEPVLRMKREARERETRRQQVLDKAPELFEDAVASNFPQHHEKLLAPDGVTAQAASPPTDSSQSSLPDVIAAMSKASDEDIIREFEEIESEALARIRERQQRDDQQEQDFSWRRLITEGIKRRRSMDVNLKARNQLLCRNHRPEDYDLSERSSLESFEFHQ